MNMEIGIICVWDFWGIAYYCFGLWGRGKGMGFINECARERNRPTEKQNNRLNCQQIHIVQSVIVTFCQLI